jgi:hypothetical protein
MDAGIGMLGQSTPQMINPDTGVNLGAAERQDANNLAMARMQAKASKSSGMMGGLGAAIGGIAGGLGAMGSTAAGAALI